MVGNLGALGGEALVEGVDIGLEVVRHGLGVLAHPLDDLAAIGLHRAVEFRDVAGDEGAERAGVAGELLGQFRAAVADQFLEGFEAQIEARRGRSGCGRRPC